MDVQRNLKQDLIIISMESFHAHFTDGVRSGEGDWEVRLIDQSDSTEDLR